MITGPDGDGLVVDDAQRSLESDTVSDRYGRFLLEDLLPFVHDSVAVSITTDPARRALMGVSSGCASAPALSLGLFLPIRAAPQF